ncbi:hypothetical protein DUI70_5260 [Streptomyces albus]|nr:hypothetical protein SLNHY_5347 [Streptomyces albus]AYN35756.1 hypothetical protein DUI70_5260 [Streptomyces albus]
MTVLTPIVRCAPGCPGARLLSAAVPLLQRGRPDLVPLG